MAIIFCCVIASLSLVNSTEIKVNTVENVLPSNDLNSSGLQEINMNQSIHTGNPQF